jgi:ParB family transcriptional regulator, chromosome partitioning protein
MKIKNIPLSQLVPSPDNVRKTDRMNGIAGLAANIAAKGLLQNLQVRPAASGTFEVVAGGRRLAALKLLAKKKALAKDAPVACNVLAKDEDAAEISLAENEMRQAMHPADQFEAFKALVDSGHGIEDVAARFGVAPTVVRQRLKLAAVSPMLMVLYRKAAMSLDQMMAFTVSDDHAAQEAAWFDAPEWQRSASAIRQRLTAAHVRADDRRARFVTAEAYVEAGGSVVTDLFRADSNSYLTDPALLDRLVTEKLEREADAVRHEGWKWVLIMPDFDALDGYGEMRGKALPMPPKQAKALAKALREADRLRDRDELDDDEAARLDALEEEIAALSERTFIWSDRQKARGGAILGIEQDGRLGVMRGLIRPEDIKAKPADESPPVRRSPSEGGCFSSALADDLTAHRTAALRVMLAERPIVALAAAVHALALPVFYEDGDSALALHVVTPALRAEGLDGSEAMKRSAQQRGLWATQLPEQTEALWDWLLTQDADTLTKLLAYCVSCTVKPMRDPCADQLAAAVALDMAQWWQPTVPGYLGRVSKTLIREAVTEAKGKAAADNIATLKKGDMATHAAELLNGTGWLPAMLRAA